MKRVGLFLMLTLFVSQISFVEAQEKDSLPLVAKKVKDTLTYETASGLPIAASKIYFSDAKFTFSGFYESNFISYQGSKNRASGDLELYQTNLQRFVTYAAYKPVDWMVVYAEIFLEYANDGSREDDLEYLPEVFLDFLIDERFNVRVGTHQPQIGYINNNDEPVMFYSVNRPEVERLIVPSQWIDLGIMTYGQAAPNLKWSLSAYQGLDATNLNSSTWLRGGREDALRFNFNNYLVNSSLTYTGIKDTEIGVNGIYTSLGSDQMINVNNEERNVNASSYLLASYVRHQIGNWSLMGFGSYGSMSGTEDIFELTKNEEGIGQVLGKNVFGFYGEVGYDVLPILGINKRKERGKDDNFILKANEMKLPLFFRYERLNTHASINDNLTSFVSNQNDLNAFTLGANFNPRRSIVIKANYQIRDNSEPLINGEFEGNRFEVGVGFIF